MRILNLPNKGQQAPQQFLILLTLLLFMMVLSLAQQYIPLRDHCRVDGQTEESEIYMSYSTRTLSQADIQRGNFSDAGITYEEGLFCDPALFYKDETKRSYAAYLGPGDRIHWEIIPTDITMFNLTQLKSASMTEFNISQLWIFSSLQSLGLRGGVINTIDVPAFQHFPNLAILDLSGNGLTTLPRGFLQYFPRLTIFLFHYNDVKEYYPDTFCNLPYLFSINMNAAFHSGIFPRELFSSQGSTGQDLAYCNESQSFSNTELLRLSRNNFTVMPNASFNRLGIDNELQIAGSSVQHIEPDAFAGLSHLTVLILDDNDISHLPVSALKPLDNLRELRIVNNSMNFISFEHFRHNSKIEVLDFTRNHLEQLHGTWKHLSKLFYFRASHNRLKSLRENTLSGLQGLRELYLDHNAIENIDAGALNGTGKNDYFILSLSYNNLQQLDPLVLQGMSSLRGLQLNHNKLAAVDPSIFEGKANLTSLYLNGNAIRTIQNETYTPLKQLKVLHLGNNQIMHLNKGTFSTLQKLALLDLSGNQIGELDDDLMQSLVSLKVFSIADNKMKYLNASLWDDRSLIQVNLSYNPWNCSCSLSALITWTKQNLAVLRDSSRNTTCRYPPAMSGTQLSHLQLDHCEDEGAADKGYVPVLIVICIVVIIIIVLIGIGFYFRKEIEVLLFIEFNIRLRKPTSLTPEQEARMIYDVFVSSNQADLAFVKKDIMPRLKQQSKLEVCIHVRDFSVGATVVDNISDAIEQSRRTILLLSRSLLKNEWSQEEFQHVHQKLIREDKQRLIVIFMEKIPPTEIGDKVLRSHVCSSASVHLGGRLFWERIMFEMPQKSRSQGEGGAGGSLHPLPESSVDRTSNIAMDYRVQGSSVEQLVDD